MAADSPVQAGATSLTLPVLGMSCAACQRHVEQALAAAPGVVTAQVDLMRHRAHLSFDPAKISPDGIVQVIRASGYEAVLPREDAGAAQYPPTEGQQGLKAAVTPVGIPLALRVTGVL